MISSHSTLRTYAAGVMTLCAVLGGCSSDDDATDVTIPAGAWVGETMDGEQVVVTPGGSTSFEGDVPQPVAIIDAAADCEAVTAEFTFWVRQIATSDVGLRASAYAQHAKERQEALGC